MIHKQLFSQQIFRGEVSGPNWLTGVLPMFSGCALLDGLGAKSDLEVFLSKFPIFSDFGFRKKKCNECLKY